MNNALEIMIEKNNPQNNQEREIELDGNKNLKKE